MSVPKNNGKKKSLLKTNKETKTAELTSGDIRLMHNNTGFRQYLKDKGKKIESIPTKNIMYEEFMKYLKSTGQ